MDRLEIRAFRTLAKKYKFPAVFFSRRITRQINGAFRYLSTSSRAKALQSVDIPGETRPFISTKNCVEIPLRLWDDLSPWNSVLTNITNASWIQRWCQLVTRFCQVISVFAGLLLRDKSHSPSWLHYYIVYIYNLFYGIFERRCNSRALVHLQRIDYFLFGCLCIFRIVCFSNDWFIRIVSKKKGKKHLRFDITRSRNSPLNLPRSVDSRALGYLRLFSETLSRRLRASPSTACKMVVTGGSETWLRSDVTP